MNNSVLRAYKCKMGALKKLGKQKNLTSLKNVQNLYNKEIEHHFSKGFKVHHAPLHDKFRESYVKSEGVYSH